MRLIGGMLAGAIVVSFATFARADEPQRLFGVGTALGGGITAGTLTTSLGAASTSGIDVAFILPTLEAQYFPTDKISLALTLPVSNMMLASALARGVVVSGQALFELNLGRDNLRVIFGLGVGGTYVDSNVYTGQNVRGGGVQLPAEIGLEVMSEGRGFGFKVLVRPWLEIGSSTTTDTLASTTTTSGYFGGGAVFLVGFSGYYTRPARHR